MSWWTTLYDDVFRGIFRSADENIRKKMEEYEATQEILLKRITEKDKAITKTR